LAEAARAAQMGAILTFGGGQDADFRLASCDLGSDGSNVTAMTPQGEISYRLGAPGRHWVMNSLCVLATVHAAGGSVEKAADTLAELTPPSGRGARFDIQMQDGAFVLIDESYNASPAAMRAAMAVLAAQSVGEDGRRIAVLGDMLEMGDESAALHIDLAQALEQHNIDLAFLAGEAMKDLWTALPEHRRGQLCDSSDHLATVMRDIIRPGDVVMVKGSAGVRMGRVVEALKSLDTSKLQKGEG